MTTISQGLQTLDPFTDMYTYTGLCLANPLDIIEFAINVKVQFFSLKIENARIIKGSRICKPCNVLAVREYVRASMV